MSSMDMIALAVLACVVGYVVLEPKPGAKGKPGAKAGPGRAFIDAMHEVQKQAAATKIETLFGSHPSNPFLAPFAGMTPPDPPDPPATSPGPN